jgi:hypothetical protein
MHNFLQVNYELVSIKPYPQSIPALNNTLTKKVELMFENFLKAKTKFKNGFTSNLSFFQLIKCLKQYLS